MVNEDLRTYLKKRLHAEEMKIVFVKANGERREMRCTLNSLHLPMKAMQALEENKAREKTENTEILAVWDLDNEGWRSFRIDNVISYDVIEDRVS